MALCVTLKLLSQYVCIQVFIVLTIGLLNAYFVCLYLFMSRLTHLIEDPFSAAVSVLVTHTL